MLRSDFAGWFAARPDCQCASPSRSPPSATPPTLIAAFIKFYTQDDGKDHDSSWKVTIYSDQNDAAVEYTKNDDIGYSACSESELYKMDVRSYTGVVGSQQQVTISIFPNGNDTWRFKFALILTFSDQSDLHTTVAAVNLSQDKDQRAHSYYIYQQDDLGPALLC